MIGILNPEEPDIAQKVLDEGIPGGKKIYGYYKNKFYAFQPDNVGGYHGYPIPEIDVPTPALRQMRDLGLFKIVLHLRRSLSGGYQ